MTTWFQTTKRNDISDIFFFKDNGKEAEKDTLSIKASNTVITSDDDYFYLCTYGAVKVEGYRIMNDKKGDEPSSYLGKPVVVAVQRKPIVTNAYKDKVTEVTQTASHAYVAGQLEALDTSKVYDLTTLNFNNSTDIHKALNDVGSSPEAAVTATLYGKLLFSFTEVDESSSGNPEQIASAKSLAAAVIVPRASGGYSKGNYQPKETHAEILAARRTFFVTELGGKDETILGRLAEVGVERLEAIEVLLRIMDI